MVRGNWQKRVESAKARKVAAKERKQHRENRGLYKTKVNEFLSVMDRYYGSHRKPITLHIWVESCPSDWDESKLLYAQHDEDVGRKHQRPSRSNSIDKDETEYKKERKRGAGGGRKAKPHPRSKQAHDTDVDQAKDTCVGSESAQLCCNHFFTGSCFQEQRSRKGGDKCNYYTHYVSDSDTLFGVVGVNSGACREMLAQSLEASHEHSIDDIVQPDRGIAMLYHFCVELSSNGDERSSQDRDISATATSDNDEINTNRITVFEAVSKALSTRSCGLGSMVYVAKNEILLFDRYQDGLLISVEELVETVFEGHTEGRERGLDANTTLVASEDATSLFAPVLEHILKFLPDSCVSTMKRVCRSWTNEIGTSSPDLWRYLITRRKWPLPLEPTPNDDGLGSQHLVSTYHNTFVSHYKIVRAIHAVKEAMVPLLSSGRAVQNEEGTDWVAQAFSSRRGSPHHSNSCVGVKIWSSNRMLAAYSEDCSLRLFEVTTKQDENGGVKKVCRQVVCVDASPYKNKSRTCHLASMDMDNTVIVCICDAGDETASEQLLVTISREDFLCESGGTVASGTFDLDDTSLHVVNIADELRRYLENDVGFWIRFTEPVGNTVHEFGAADVIINACTEAVACWNGLALLEVELYAPPPLQALVCRKLVVISLGAAVVVSTIDRPLHSNTELTIAREKQRLTQHSIQSPCRLAIANSFNDGTGIERSMSQVQLTRAASQVEAAPLGDHFNLSQSLGGVWEPIEASPTAMTISESDIVVMELVSRGAAGSPEYELCSRILFFPLQDQSENIPSPPDVLRLDETGPELESIETRSGGRSYCIESVGEYAIFFSRFGTYEHIEGVNVKIDQRTVAGIIHIPTRQQVDRVILINESRLVNRWTRFLSIKECEIFMSSVNGILGVAVSCMGIILAGECVRSVGEAALTAPQSSEGLSSSAKKKKKKRQAGNKDSKKDGFARGMSLRG